MRSQTPHRDLLNIAFQFFDEKEGQERTGCASRGGQKYQLLAAVLGPAPERNRAPPVVVTSVVTLVTEQTTVLHFTCCQDSAHTVDRQGSEG